jgi:RNA polymerase sigma factor (sigma-70 family)
MSQGETAVSISRIENPEFQSSDLLETRLIDAAARGRTSVPSDVHGVLPHVGRNSYSSATVSDLLKGAQRGDQVAWKALVDRFTPLVMGIARTYRLTTNDAVDVSQTVWLQLFLHLVTIREPEALPGWIATTARRASLQLTMSISRTIPVNPIDETVRNLHAVDAEVDARVLRSEMLQAVRDGLAELPGPQRDLLVLLASSPRLSYRDISERLGIPVGSIGPTRARAVARLRATRALQAFSGSLPDPEQTSSDALAAAGAAPRQPRTRDLFLTTRRVA